MPCSHCKGIGHNKRTCPELKKNILQKEPVPQEQEPIQTQPQQNTITQMIQQQNTE